MRERWTDDRLDDLNGKVDALRMEMKTEFTAVRGEMRDRFDKIDKRFDRMEERFDRSDERFERMEARSDERFERMEVRSDERFERMGERFDQRLDSLNRTIVLFSGGACAALIAALGGLIATQL